MPPLLKAFIQAFIPLFVAIDPIGIAALFLGLAEGVPAAERQRVARHATLTGGAVALVFLLLGQNIFRALGISVADFQIAGGLILFVLAGRDLVLPDTAGAKMHEGFGVVPLGMPIIAGPALITTLLVLAQSPTIGFAVTLAALGVNLALIVLAFAFSEAIRSALGATGMRAISKIISMLLAAIAVNMIRRGVTGL